MDIVEAFRGQAAACGRLGSRMYAELLDLVADDLAAGGPAADVLRGHEHDPGPSGLALRFAGSVHRLVLERRAGALAAYYPTVGGSWDAAAGWTAFRALLAESPDAVRAWLDRAPQTNEVGRATALMGGLLEIGRLHDHPVRLFEIGSSGGLNLLADRFRYVTAGRSVGPVDSPVVLDPAWAGPVPDVDPPAVVERLGSDLMPIDVRTTEGRLALTAYVWPDQTQRFERLRGALDLAQDTPFVVRRQPAADFVEDLALRDETTTVLWHSVMWQYLGAGEQARVTAALARLGDRATVESPFAHLRLEPARRTTDSEHEFLVLLTVWPTGERRILGTARAHGVPMSWE